MHRNSGNVTTAMSPISPAYKQSQVVAGYVVATIVALVLGLSVGVFGGSVALIVILSVLFGAAVVWNYRIGVVLALLILPLSDTQALFPRMAFGITGLNPLNILLVATFFSIIAAWLFRRDEHKVPGFPPLLWFLVLPMLVAALNGSFFVEDIPGYFRDMDVIRFDSVGGYLRDIFLKPMVIIAVAMLVAIVARNSRRPELLLIPFFLSASVLALAVVGYTAVSGVSLDTLALSDSRGFLAWVGMHANEQGVLFNMVICLAFFTFLSIRWGAARLLLAMVICLAMMAVALTFSRGAYLGFLVMMLYFLVTRRQVRVLLIGMIFAVLGALLMPQAIVDRAGTGLGDRDMDQVSAGRVRLIWTPLAPTIIEKPILGHGLGSILWSKPARMGTLLPVGNPHSAYLGLLLDFGVLGTIVIALFYRRLWQLFRKLRENLEVPVWRGFFEGASVCILVLAVEGVTGNSFIPTRAQSYLWLAMGLAIGLAKRMELHSPSPSDQTVISDKDVGAAARVIPNSYKASSRNSL